jgi:hypothetical protein
LEVSAFQALNKAEPLLALPFWIKNQKVFLFLQFLS